MRVMGGRESNRRQLQSFHGKPIGAAATQRSWMPPSSRSGPWTRNQSCLTHQQPFQQHVERAGQDAGQVCPGGVRCLGLVLTPALQLRAAPAAADNSGLASCRHPSPSAPSAAAAPRFLHPLLLQGKCRPRLRVLQGEDKAAAAAQWCLQPFPWCSLPSCNVFRAPNAQRCLRAPQDGCTCGTKCNVRRAAASGRREQLGSLPSCCCAACRQTAAGCPACPWLQCGSNCTCSVCPGAQARAADYQSRAVSAPMSMLVPMLRAPSCANITCKAN